MALFIKGDDIGALAEKVRRATGAKSKSDAVRRALRNELKRARKSAPLLERLTEARRFLDRIGKPNPKFDMKTFTDKLWGS